MCGEKFIVGVNNMQWLGSPPHVRGKVNYCSCIIPRHRITPACAGKSYTDNRQCYSNQDHPRMCGEKTKKILIKSPFLILRSTFFIQFQIDLIHQQAVIKSPMFLLFINSQLRCYSIKLVIRSILNHFF